VITTQFLFEIPVFAFFLIHTLITPLSFPIPVSFVVLLFLTAVSSLAPTPVAFSGDLTLALYAQLQPSPATVCVAAPVPVTFAALVILVSTALRQLFLFTSFFGPLLLTV
jgi:hypothetical protein